MFVPTAYQNEPAGPVLNPRVLSHHPFKALASDTAAFSISVIYWKFDNMLKCFSEGSHPTSFLVIKNEQSKHTSSQGQGIWETLL